MAFYSLLQRELTRFSFLLAFIFKYDFEVRLPGNGARRASVLAIMDLILRNADLDFYTKDPPGALIEIFVEPALSIVNNGFTQVYVVITNLLDLIAVICIMTFILNIEGWQIFMVFAVILPLIAASLYMSTQGVQRYVEEREDAQNEWVFFTKQTLTVLPSARIYGLEGVLLDRLEKLLKVRR